MTIGHRELTIIADFKQVLQDFPVLSFDKRRLQQVLYNLLTNAIKFTRKGNIIITAEVKPKVDTLDELMLEVSVTDKGIGISDDEATKVFNGFFDTRNLESKRLNPYGNGIGLSFCKQVCQSLDGDISVKSVLGSGSQFTFTMKVMKVYSYRQEERYAEESKISPVSNNEILVDSPRIHYDSSINRLHV